MTTEVTPSAVKRPPIRTPQTYDSTTARPTPITAKRATSRKMVGSRLRQLVSGAPSKTVALSPDSTSTRTNMANTVVSIRTGTSRAGISEAWTSSSNSAPSGSR
ncbi:Uncharacterised protein [Mycobacterium tuberculosis]|nr:Uncharacterised protein [Mycobacterium tuberculosis]